MNLPEENDFKRYSVVARRRGIFEVLGYENSTGPNAVGAPSKEIFGPNLQVFKIGWYFTFRCARLSANNTHCAAPELDIEIHDRWKKDSLVLRMPARPNHWILETNHPEEIAKLFSH